MVSESEKMQALRVQLTKERSAAERQRAVIESENADLKVTISDYG